MDIASHYVTDFIGGIIPLITLVKLPHLLINVIMPESMPLMPLSDFLQLVADRVPRYPCSSVSLHEEAEPLIGAQLQLHYSCIEVEEAAQVMDRWLTLYMRI